MDTEVDQELLHRARTYTGANAHAVNGALGAYTATANTLAKHNAAWLHRNLARWGLILRLRLAGYSIAHSHAAAQKELGALESGFELLTPEPPRGTVEEYMIERSYLEYRFLAKTEEPGASDAPDIQSWYRADVVVATTPAGREVVLKDRRGERGRVPGAVPVQRLRALLARYEALRDSDALDQPERMTDIEAECMGALPGVLDAYEALARLATADTAPCTASTEYDGLPTDRFLKKDKE